MIEVQIKVAQLELQTLAAKAFEGEEIVIMVGTKKLRLTPAETNGTVTPSGPRPGRGAWKGRVTIPDSFYLPWSAEEMGERED